MNLISVKETAEKWGMTPRRVQLLCNDNRIPGAQRVGNYWVIPDDAEKPDDARKKEVGKKALVNQNIRIERVWAMPNKNTFDADASCMGLKTTPPNAVMGAFCAEYL